MPAVFHGPGAGERHAIGPSELVLKATGGDTGGSFFLIGAIASRYDFRLA